MEQVNLSGYRVPRVIANLEPTDRVGFITPNPVGTDQARYAEQLRSEIRLALGGIDDLSITNVTATEIKSAYGRVSATAKKKCLQLYTYGICKCFELMIFQEEQIFRKSLAYQSGIQYPIPPEDPNDDLLYEKYVKQKDKYEAELQQAIDLAVETKEIPDGVVGLAPDGNRNVSWRWMGPVYEDTAQDKLNQSIFTRNLQELGVDSIEALKYLFPSKTDDEIAGMLSGYPFRMVGELQRSYSQLIDLVNQEMRTPHPQQPNLPMAADPRLDLTPFLYRTLESLQKEVTYAGRYRSADPIGTPSIPDPADQLRGSSGSVGSPGSNRGNVSPMGGDLPADGGTYDTSASPDGGTLSEFSPYSVQPPGIPGSPTAGESLQGGVQQGSGRPEFTSPIPVPGSTVSSFANQGLQTSMPGINNNPAYLDNYSQISADNLEITEGQLLNNGVSPQSINVIDHFGPDSAAILNDYSCELEDAVGATNAQLTEAAGLLQELSQEHKVYERILTDPDILADYTCEFFGENGPYPVPEGRVAPQGQPVGQQFANVPQVTGQPQVTAPQRPEMPIPPQPQRPADPNAFWNNFGSAADRNPAEAWKYLNVAQQNPEVFRQKLLVME